MRGIAHGGKNKNTRESVAFNQLRFIMLNRTNDTHVSIRNEDMTCGSAAVGRANEKAGVGGGGEEGGT